MINIQPIEKRQYTNGATLDVHQIFHTIQGEGPFCGMPCVFVRLAGCNLQCPGCDTDYTSDRVTLHMEAIVATVKDLMPANYTDKLVVITGGEPFRQNITPFVKQLNAYGFHVQIETNGTLPPTSDFVKISLVTIVCSPKAGKVHQELAPFIDAYKYVMRDGCVDDTDGLPIFALDHTAAPHVARPHAGFKGPIYLQPMDPGYEIGRMLNTEAVLQSCLKHGYMLQLQIHKLIGVA